MLIDLAPAEYSSSCLVNVQDENVAYYDLSTFNAYIPFANKLLNARE